MLHFFGQIVGELFGPYLNPQKLPLQIGYSPNVMVGEFPLFRGSLRVQVPEKETPQNGYRGSFWFPVGSTEKGGSNSTKGVYPESP